MKPERRPDAGTRRRIGLRATLLQAVWNYETLQGVGFAWAIHPGLERLYPDKGDRARRVAAYLDVFNSNPYLSTLGLGVALRIEAQVASGVAGAERRRVRLLRALRGSLGALGDELFWVGWRPALALWAVVVVLIRPSPWAAVGFVLAFNAVAQPVRLRGVRAGYASGAGVARVLQDPIWRQATAVARGLGAIAAGVATTLGLLWAWGSAGGLQTVGVFSGSFALLWVARSRFGSGRELSPTLSFLVVLILLSVIHRLVEGVSP